MKPFYCYLSKYSSSLIIQLSHMTISCSCSGVLHRHTEDNAQSTYEKNTINAKKHRQGFLVSSGQIKIQDHRQLKRACDPWPVCVGRIKQRRLKVRVNKRYVPD